MSSVPKAPASTTPVGTLVFFGDSLTDNGNLSRVTGGVKPGPNYWQGRFSNGPTYAEIIAGLLVAKFAATMNFAFGGAEAAGARPIDLDAQVTSYIGSLNGANAPDGTTAVLNIGNNDYLNFGGAGAPPIEAVLAAISAAVQRLALVSVDKIVLSTLADISVTPLGHALAETNPGALLGAQAMIAANNEGLVALVAQLQSQGIDVELVDTARLANEVGADAATFGFDTTAVSMLAGGLAAFNPNEIAFYDDIHPSYALHGVSAVFTAAWLAADTVRMSGDGRQFVFGNSGADLVFAGAGDDYVSGGAGNDTIFSGLGNDYVYGGAGNDLIAGGGGNDLLFGGAGNDIVAGGAGNNGLDGGSGDDLLIVDRSGSNFVYAGSGNDLIVIKFDNELGAQQVVLGGSGQDTLRFVIAPLTANADAEIAQAQASFDALAALFNPATAWPQTYDGISLSGVERIELQVDRFAVGDVNVPYLVTHDIVDSAGAIPSISSAMVDMIDTGQLWGLMTA